MNKENKFGLPEHIAALKAGIALTKSGYAGVTSTGKIVDRRKDKTAIPIQENLFFGAPKPKKV